MPLEIFRQIVLNAESFYDERRVESLDDLAERVALWLDTKYITCKTSSVAKDEDGLYVWYVFYVFH